MPAPYLPGWLTAVNGDPLKCGRKTKKIKILPLKVATWNIRTLLDRANSDRPQRRTALIAAELSRYNIDLAALSETRLAGEGELTEKSSGYSFFWSGRPPEEKREAGVGFAIKTPLLNNLVCPPKGLNDRLATMRVPLSYGKKFATIISAYAPTMTNSNENKDRFYEELDALIRTVPTTDKLIILGDFNARVGCDSASWGGVLGKQGIGKCNSNGLLLLQMCARHDLLITNTVFHLPTRKKTS